MRTIAVLNQKGGVGKTTTVANTAAALAAFGAKVLTIDFDPQAHLTIHLGIEPQSIDSGSYKVLTQSARIESEITMVRENLWLLPANIDLVGAESELVSVVGREIILREALEGCQQDFDYCLIDCAPSLGLLTLNALAAAQEVLIPLQPHFLALQGFGKLLQTVEIVNRRINPSLRVNGILLCMFDSRASLPNEVKADIERFLNDARGTNSAWSEAHVLPVLVRRNIKLAEAPSYGKTIFEYESSCNGAQDYQKVAEFIHGKENIPQESSESLDNEESTEQLEPEQTEVQDQEIEQTHEDETQNTDIQDGLPETETEISQEHITTEQADEQFAPLTDEYVSENNYEQPQQTSEEEQSQSEYKPEYSEQDEFAPLTDEYIPQDEPQNQEQTQEEPQPEFQSEYTEHPHEQETAAESNDIQNNFTESEPEKTQDYNYSEQNENEFAPLTDENTTQDDFQNQDQIQEEPQQIESEYKPGYSEQVQSIAPENNDTQENQEKPEQFNSRPERPNVPTRIPPFRISEIRTRSYSAPEQYTQIPEESNQPEQKPEENPSQENSGF